MNRNVSTALIGATSLEQLENNLPASSWRMMDEDLREVEKATSHYREIL